MIGWASKVRFDSGATVSGAVGHFIDPDGTTACSKLTQVSKVRGLEPRYAPFKCAWGPHDAERDHKCRECKKLRDPQTTCRCGLCRPGARA